MISLMLWRRGRDLNGHEAFLRLRSQRILIQFRCLSDGNKNLVKHRDTQKPHGPDINGNGHLRPGGSVAGEVA